jgi:hypothetical protein
MEYIVEAVTTTGTIIERYASYEEAQARVESIPADTLLGMPLIFRELPDDSVRLVREDGKPLQWHRLEGRDRDVGDEPLPLIDELPEAAGFVGPAIRAIEPRRDEDEEPPIPLADIGHD